MFGNMMREVRQPHLWFSAAWRALSDSVAGDVCDVVGQGRHHQAWGCAAPRV